MKKPFLILFFSATISRKWLRLKVRRSVSLKKRQTKLRNLPKSLSQIAVSVLKTRRVFKGKSNKHCETDKTFNVKLRNTTRWSLRSSKRSEKSYRNFIKTQRIQTTTRYMKNQKKIASLNRTSILKPIGNSKSISISKVTIIPIIQTINGF